MSAIVLATSHQQTQAARRPNQLLSVLAWEMRRFRDSRTTWWLSLLICGIFLFVLWLIRFPSSGSVTPGTGPDTITFTVPVTSAGGLTLVLSILTFLLALILPFVNADGATRDYKRQTHELLMSTPLPGWAYIWGRYLACLLVSMGIAVLLLVSLLLMGLILHLTQADYPLPQPAVIVLIWSVAFVPIAALISSVSFTLGTILQRHTQLAKFGMLLIWFIFAIVLPVIPVGGSGQAPSWYLHWEPTNIGMVVLLQAPYDQGTTAIFESVTSGESASTFRSSINNVEQQVPDLSQWILPHLAWVVVGLALVALAATTFKRYRTLANS